jgi:hypothetical protein
MQAAVTLSSGFPAIGVWCDAPSASLFVSNTTFNATAVQNVVAGPRHGTRQPHMPTNQFVPARPGNRPATSNGGGKG